MVCLKAISHLDIATIVPLGGQISFEEISTRTGLPVQMVRRFLRHAMTMRIFRELESGMVAHTKASRALTVPHMNDWLKVGSEEVWPASVKVKFYSGLLATGKMKLTLGRCLTRSENGQTRKSQIKP